MGLFSLSLALLVARLVMTPLYGLHLNYLIVVTPAAAAGLAAVYAVALRRERAIAVIAALVIGLPASIWLLAESLGGSPTTRLNESDNGRIVTVASGGQVTVDLPGNPTTGYSWKATIGDPSVLSETSPPVFTPSSSALGASGTYTFKYKALAGGRTDLTLVYQRSWETSVPPLKTYKISVVVQ